MKNAAFVILLGAGALAVMATNASARIVCNDEGDCWHTHSDYDYPPGIRLEVHPDDWTFKEGDKRAWHEHEGEGRGYWHGGAWAPF
jgi:hypothetical protein